MATATNGSLKDWIGAERANLALVFTDVVGSSQLARDLGHEQMGRVREDHFQQGNHFILEFRGWLIKTIGDSLMIAFKAVDSAFDFARKFQQNPGHPSIQIRAGIHVGVMDVKDQDLFGTSVDLCARVVGAARGAEIWLSTEAKRDLDSLGLERVRHLVWLSHQIIPKGFPESTFWSVREAHTADGLVGEGSQTRVDVALAIEDIASRCNIRANVDAIAASLNDRTEIRIGKPSELVCDIPKILSWLTDYFDRDTNRSLILISDLLLRQTPDSRRTSFASQCQLAVGNHAFGVVAVAPKLRQAPDIDRSVRPDASREDLEKALRLVIERTNYLTTPLGSPRLEGNRVEIRPVRNNETEFRKYFELRHRVYTIMGYLDPEVENCRSKLEINEADLHSIHLGAFSRIGQQERLVGTIRMVTNQDLNTGFLDTFQSLVKNDRVLKQRLQQPYPLGLPIFQTYRELTRQMREIFRGNEWCGEISRVIVDREFRGSGIAHRLLAEVLRRGDDQRIRRVFLECLRTHEKLYQSHGFTRIEGLERPPVDVNRTMIAMQRTQAG